MNPMRTIDVAVACRGWTEACPEAETLVRGAAELALAHGARALGLEWQGPVELGIILADAADQQRLNREYRGVDEPTNVLAFSAWVSQAPLPRGAPILLGDVVLALEIVGNEAREQGKSLDNHLRHLVVHGVLHLLGYDHVADAEAVVMESLEKSILAELGVTDPYRDTMSSFEPAAPLR
jgi:probable rRNA maturation factor